VISSSVMEQKLLLVIQMVIIKVGLLLRLTNLKEEKLFTLERLSGLTMSWKRKLSRLCSSQNPTRTHLLLLMMVIKAWTVKGVSKVNAVTTK